MKKNIFKNNLSYKDALQVDGAFSVAHINYEKTPIFNGVKSKIISKNSRKKSISNYEKIEDIGAKLLYFNGTEGNFKKEDQVEIWKYYWIEYINTYDKLIRISPNSVVTAYIGRHAIELGFKYLLILKNVSIPMTHNLGNLSKLLYSIYNIKDDYMKNIDEFCEIYCKYIEGENVEYFRFPEYKKNEFFAGNRLDIEWLSYNFSIILLKLIHFADLDNEI